MSAIDCRSLCRGCLEEGNQVFGRHKSTHPAARLVIGVYGHGRLLVHALGLGQSFERRVVGLAYSTHADACIFLENAGQLFAGDFTALLEHSEKDLELIWPAGNDVQISVSEPDTPSLDVLGGEFSLDECRLADLDTEQVLVRRAARSGFAERAFLNAVCTDLAIRTSHDMTQAQAQT